MKKKSLLKLTAVLLGVLICASAIFALLGTKTNFMSLLASRNGYKAGTSMEKTVKATASRSGKYYAYDTNTTGEYPYIWNLEDMSEGGSPNLYCLDAERRI